MHVEDSAYDLTYEVRALICYERKHVLWDFLIKVMFMMTNTRTKKDPFHFHPELRQLIKPFNESFYRSITTEKIRAQIENSGHELQIDFYKDDVRERLRSEALSQHTGDLYVFGYASLM